MEITQYKWRFTLYRIKIHRNCIKIRQNDEVQKDVKNASKIWLRNGTKNNNTSSHILLDHCYPFGLSLKPSGLKKKFLEEGDPRDLFSPRPGSAPGRIWPKNNNTCKGPWVLHPYQVSSKSIKRFWRRSQKCEKFTDGRRTTDRTDRRTDGRRTVRYDNSSLEPSAQVS